MRKGAGRTITQPPHCNGGSTPYPPWTRIYLGFKIFKGFDR